MSADSSSNTSTLGEFPGEPGNFDQFMDRNQKLLAVIGVVIALAAAAYVVYRGFENSSEKAAGAALSQADDTASFEKIVKEYPGTAAAGSARLLLAEKQWNDGQQDASIATLKEFIATAKDHPALPSAQASLGSKLAAQGKNDEAAKTFEDLAGNSSARFLAPFALLSLGDIANTAGDKAKAESYYQRAQNEFPDSTFANTAAKRIGLLKAKPPVEIEAPPAPAPAPAAAPGTDVPTPSFAPVPQP